MITKSAENRSQSAEPLLFTKNARTAWGHAIGAAMAAGARPQVLLPAYIGFTEREGSGVLDPVEGQQAPFRFYRVDQSLRVDMAALEAALEEGTIGVVLVIHYFGLCRNDMPAIAALCRRHGAWLIEDCAHAFQLGLAAPVLGCHGDASFYSLHKYLASESGGALRVNNPALAPAPLAAEQRIALDALEQYARTDFGAVSAIRCRNFALYQEQLPAHPGLVPMYTLAAGEIPQSYPVLVKDGLREKLYFHLIERAIPVTALYYRMVAQITPHEYPLSHQLAGEILNLPLHQDITAEDVATVCAEIGRFFAAR